MNYFAHAYAFLETEDADFVAGTHYDVISPAVRTRNTDKIEVVEFFAYSCGHCYNFEPMLQQWKGKLADDVVLVPSPAIWSAPMEPHAKAFFTAQALANIASVTFANLTNLERGEACPNVVTQEKLR